MADKTMISLRVPSELLAIADAVAERDNRSRARVIIMALEMVMLSDPLSGQKKAAVPKKTKLAVGSVSREQVAVPVNAYARPEHDKANCRNQFCMICRAVGKE